MFFSGSLKDFRRIRVVLLHLGIVEEALGRILSIQEDWTLGLVFLQSFPGTPPASFSSHLFIYFTINFFELSPSQFFSSDIHNWKTRYTLLYPLKNRNRSPFSPITILSIIMLIWNENQLKQSGQGRVRVEGRQQSKGGWNEIIALSIDIFLMKK